MSMRVFWPLAIIFLDAVSMGFVFSSLPNLLETMGGDSARLFGVAMACYAGLQFLFSPILGALSDRIGRKPVLLLSILGGLVDYTAMAFASSIWLIITGRMIAGCVSGNSLLISALVADGTSERLRTRAFGWMFAAFGAGMGFGPLFGGIFADASSRAPFIAAMALSLCSLAIAVLMVKRQPVQPVREAPAVSLNPLEPLLRVAAEKSIWPYFGLYAAMTAVGNLTAILWPLYGPGRFGWSTTMLGASMAILSVFTVLTQTTLMGLLTDRFGDRRVMLFGVAFDCAAMSCIAMATSGWMVFALTPLFALGGLGLPALQSIVSKRAPEGEQGSMQGALASLSGLVMTVMPLAVTTVYAGTAHSAVGLAWLIGPGLYLLSLPTLISIIGRIKTQS